MISLNKMCAVQELQATIATYVERGATMEAEVLQNIGRSLPNELKSALPLELRDALAGGTGPAVTSSQPGARTTPVADPQPVGKSSLIDYQTGTASSTFSLCQTDGSQAWQGNDLGLTRLLMAGDYLQAFVHTSFTRPWWAGSCQAISPYRADTTAADSGSSRAHPLSTGT